MATHILLESLKTKMFLENQEQSGKVMKHFCRNTEGGGNGVEGW